MTRINITLLPLLLIACRDKSDSGDDGGTTTSVTSSTSSDLDGDGYSTDDCDDADPAVHPGASDAWYDGTDSDCSGTSDYDADSDGYGHADYDDEVEEEGLVTVGDCDDQDEQIHPGVSETWYDGVDADCAGDNDHDADADGFDGGKSGEDCDDQSSAVNPAAEEDCENGVDDDCDGLTDWCEWEWDTGRWAAEISLADTDATLIGETNGDSAGVDISARGDVNGDGFDDVLVGASLRTNSDGNFAGGAYLVSGPIRGGRSLSTADAIFLAESVSSAAGVTVDIVGDLNSDGFDDLLIGATTESSVLSHAGASYLLLGPVSGEMSLANASVILRGEYEGSNAGIVSGAGDLNADGTTDVMIGASGEYESAGAVYIFTGPLSPGTILPEAQVILNGVQEGAWAGLAIAGAGDTNGDGFGEVLIGARGTDHGGLTGNGVVYLKHGPLTGTRSLEDSDAIFIGERTSDMAGFNVSTAGDVNSDGSPDLLIGAAGGDTVYVVYSPMDGGEISLAAADAVLLGEEEDDAAGSDVTGGGDVDGDGHDDILVGARRSTRGGKSSYTSTEAGAAYLVLGPVSGTLPLSTANVTFAGSLEHGGGAGSGLTFGDLDDDNQSDLLIGSSRPHSDLHQSTPGSAHLMYGYGL